MSSLFFALLLHSGPNVDILLSWSDMLIDASEKMTTELGTEHRQSRGNFFDYNYSNPSARRYLRALMEAWAIDRHLARKIRRRITKDDCDDKIIPLPGKELVI